MNLYVFRITTGIQISDVNGSCSGFYFLLHIFRDRFTSLGNFNLPSVKNRFVFYEGRRNRCLHQHNKFNLELNDQQKKLKNNRRIFSRLTSSSNSTNANPLPAWVARKTGILISLIAPQSLNNSYESKLVNRTKVDTAYLYVKAKLSNIYKF